MLVVTWRERLSGFHLQGFWPQGVFPMGLLPLPSFSWVIYSQKAINDSSAISSGDNFLVVLTRSAAVGARRRG